MKTLHTVFLGLAAVYAISGQALAQPKAYLEDIDVFFDCALGKPYGASTFWVTVTGQDGTAYRQGVLTYDSPETYLELDATLYPDRVEAKDYSADHMALTIDVASGEAQFQASPDAPKAAGTCKVRN